MCARRGSRGRPGRVAPAAAMAWQMLQQLSQRCYLPLEVSDFTLVTQHSVHSPCTGRVDTVLRLALMFTRAHTCTWNRRVLQQLLKHQQQNSSVTACPGACIMLSAGRHVQSSAARSTSG